MRRFFQSVTSGRRGFAIILLLAVLAGIAVGIGLPQRPLSPAALAELAKPGPLGDEWLGNPDAPITIIEYSSLTCTHCAHFHEISFPILKSNYIDTGKVRFTLREFPTDRPAMGAFALARCAKAGGYYPMIALLFSKQTSWAFSDQPVDKLFEAVEPSGLSRDTFNSCLKDQRVWDAIREVGSRGDALGINGTPTFFINGVRKTGAMTPDELDAALLPLTKT